MLSPIETTTPTLKSCSSFNDSIPSKRQLNARFKRSLFSSLRIKKYPERPTFDGLYNRISDSRWSLYSVGSTNTDDFNWSLQPNYLKMMNDTNLIDNCEEAQMEIQSAREQSAMKHFEFLETNTSKIQRTTVDPDQLLQWIVYMEKYLEAFSPDWKEVKEMSDSQRNASYNEQCDLRQYIASHNRIFSQMIKEQDNQRTRSVEEKFHMLLLNAIEKQCLLEGYPKIEDEIKQQSNDKMDVKLDVYKLCSIDIEPQYAHDPLESTLIRSTESLDSDPDSDVCTIITSDDGINFPTHPTTSKSSLFSEDHCSPFSSHPDFQHQSWENIIKELDSIDTDSQSVGNELQKHRKASNSSISESTLKLIENVDSVLPKAPAQNLEEYFNKNSKVDDWLFHQPSEHTELKMKKVNVEKRLDQNVCSTSSSDRSSLGSANSIQWDNFQDTYTLTVPIHEEPSNEHFLYFGDDYDDALKGKVESSSSISDIVKSTTSVPTSPSKSEKSVHTTPKIGTSTEIRTVCRKRKRNSRKSNKGNTTVIERTKLYNNSEMARDILLITEDLRNNYMNLKPQDFDGILKICKENLGCLIVVLDKERRSHYQSNDSMKSVGDDRIYIQESCRCGMIGQFVARIVNFLYECSRNVRRSLIYRFLLKMLKNFYAMVKFVSQKVRIYRSYYGKY